MAKGVKFNATGSEEYAVKLGNHALYISDEGGGPSVTTGFYALPDIPTGGYVIIGPTTAVRTAANDAELLVHGEDLGLPTSSVYALIENTLSNDDIIILGDKDIVSGDNTLAHSGIGHYVKYHKDEFVIRMTGQEEPSFFTYSDSTYDVTSKDFTGGPTQWQILSALGYAKLFEFASDSDALAMVQGSYGNQITGFNFRMVPDESLTTLSQIDDVKRSLPPGKDALASINQNFWWPIADAGAMMEMNWWLWAKPNLQTTFELLSKKMTYKVGLPMMPDSISSIDWGDGSQSTIPTHYYSNPGPWIVKITPASTNYEFLGNAFMAPFGVGETVWNSGDILSFGNYGFNGGLLTPAGFPTWGWDIQLEAFRNLKIANNAQVVFALPDFNDDWIQAFLDMTDGTTATGVLWDYGFVGFPYSGSASTEALNTQLENRKNDLVNNNNWMFVG